VAAVSLLWAAVVLAASSDGVVRRAVHERRAAVVASAATASVLLAVLAVLVAPTVDEQLDQSLVERPAFWSVATQVFVDNPVVGTGPDTFRETFLANRPASHGVLVDRATADSPHSVPLGMLSGGGLLTSLPYLAFVVLVGLAAVRGLRRAQGADRAVVAGFGGIWLGYQAQSLISIDVPPLTLLHFLSAAVLVAVASPPRWREIVLPGEPAAQRVTRRGVPVGDVVVPTSTRALQAALVALLVASSWFVLAPLRADVAASRALAEFGTTDARAIPGFETAERTNPGESSYSSFKAMTYAATGQPDQAYASALEAANRSPGSSRYALLVARLAAERGDTGTAVTWWREAVRRDPVAPTVLAEVGQGLLQAGEEQEALPVLRRAVELRPDVPSLVLLAQALVVDGDPEAARPLLARALELEPGEPNATRLLGSLAPAQG
jgi:hypothetical protein